MRKLFVLLLLLTLSPTAYAQTSGKTLTETRNAPISAQHIHIGSDKSCWRETGGGTDKVCVSAPASLSSSTISILWPSAAGTLATLADITATAGDVVGPASATNNNFTCFNGTTGKLIKDCGTPATVATSGSAADLSTGTLPAGRMPALTGDVTTSAGAVATTIAADAVTYAKMQNVSAASKLLGRGDSGSGDPQEITLGSGLSMSGTTLSATASGGGAVVQVKNVQSGAVVTGTTTIPLDDTIPQNTEGTEFLTLSITPASATNKLKIDVVLNATYSVAAWVIAAIFQDSTANALASFNNYQNTGTAGNSMVFTHYMTSGTTSATTFKVRAGGFSAGTITINGQTGGRLFGGTMASSMTITEIVP